MHSQKRKGSGGGLFNAIRQQQQKKNWWPAIGQIRIFRSLATWAELAISATSIDTLIIQKRALSSVVKPCFIYIARLLPFSSMRYQK